MIKAKTSIILTAIMSCGIVVSAQAYSDDTHMGQPAPIQNKVYDAMVGEWKGETEMMGKKMHDELDIEWGLNHQFLIIKLKGKPENGDGRKYEGLGIFGVDAAGKARTWWFDNWGSASTGTGEFSGNKLVLKDSHANFKETRSFELKGNEMLMHAEGTMKWDGKEKPFVQNTVYKKD